MTDPRALLHVLASHPVLPPSSVLGEVDRALLADVARGARSTHADLLHEVAAEHALPFSELARRAEFLLACLVLPSAGTHYELLGVAPDAPTHEIRRRWAGLIQRYHPDHVGGEGGGLDAQARRLIEAYQLLKDPARRREYDAELERVAALPAIRPSPLSRRSPRPRGPHRWRWAPAGILATGIAIAVWASSWPSSPPLPRAPLPAAPKLLETWATDAARKGRVTPPERAARPADATPAPESTKPREEPAPSLLERWLARVRTVEPPAPAEAPAVPPSAPPPAPGSTPTAPGAAPGAPGVAAPPAPPSPPAPALAVATSQVETTPSSPPPSPVRVAAVEAPTSPPPPATGAPAPVASAPVLPPASAPATPAPPLPRPSPPAPVAVPVAAPPLALAPPTPKPTPTGAPMPPPSAVRPIARAPVPPAAPLAPAPEPRPVVAAKPEPTPGIAAAAAPRASEVRSSPPSEPLALVESFRVAYERKDLAAVMALLGADPRERDVAGRQAVESLYARNFAVLSGIRYELSGLDVQASASGEAVVVHAHYRIRAREGGWLLGRPLDVAGPIRWTLRHETGGLRVVGIDYETPAR